MVSHLFLQTTATLFFKAKSQESLQVKNFLQLYERASEQQINFILAVASFNPNVPESLKSEICIILDVRLLFSIIIIYDNCVVVYFPFFSFV